MSSVIVFQCLSCKTIIGDSFSFAFELEDENASGFSAMSNVAVSKETKFSSNGCSFASVHCSECNMIIGRHYISTKPPFDYLRNYFSISNAAILKTVLGENHVLPKPFDPSMYDIVQAHQDIIKLKQLIIALNQKLESSMQD